MMPLYETMRRAQDGHAMGEMARSLGLSEKQVADAFAALAPAFSSGLKHNVAGPNSLASFLSTLAEGHHRRYFESVQAAFSPAGLADGDRLLDQIFGPLALRQDVAARAAQATGIASDTLKHMMPALASIIMGGLYDQAMQRTGSGSPAPGKESGDVVGDILKEMIRYQAAGRTDLPEAKNMPPFDNPAFQPFNDMMDAMFKASGMPADTWRTGKINRQSTEEPPPDVEEGESVPSGYDEIFGRMFDAGREVQQGYQKQMDALFSRYLGGDPKG